jgi:hypothetical protein
MVRVTEPIHRGLRGQVGHGLRERRRHPELAVLRCFPTEQTLLFAESATAERHQDRLLDTGRVIRFRSQPLGIRMELSLIAPSVAPPRHG